MAETELYAKLCLTANAILGLCGAYVGVHCVMHTIIRGSYMSYLPVVILGTLGFCFCFLLPFFVLFFITKTYEFIQACRHQMDTLHETPTMEITETQEEYDGFTDTEDDTETSDDSDDSDDPDDA